MIGLDDQLNSFKGQTFLTVAPTTQIPFWDYVSFFSCTFLRWAQGQDKEDLCVYSFCIFLKLDAHILEIGSRSKDIGNSLTETFSWIIQHLKHHFALNLNQILEQFFQNQFYSSLSYFNIFEKTTLGYIQSCQNMNTTTIIGYFCFCTNLIQRIWIFMFVVEYWIFEYWKSSTKFPLINLGQYISVNM